MTVTLRRTQLELFGFGYAAIRAALKIIIEHLDQLEAYNTHLRLGGDPNEHRRNKWLTREQVKAQYRKGK